LQLNWCAPAANGSDWCGDWCSVTRSSSSSWQPRVPLAAAATAYIRYVLPSLPWKFGDLRTTSSPEEEKGDGAMQPGRLHWRWQ